MLQYFLSRSALLFICSTLVVLAVGCREDKQMAVTADKRQLEPTPSSSIVANTTTAVTNSSPKQQPSKNSQIKPSTFELGLDKAASAYSISQSAHSTEDWNLVASQYQDAIALMKQVERQSPNFTTAQSKILEYQRWFKYAQRQAFPVPSPAPQGEPERVVVAFPKVSFIPQNSPSSLPVPTQEKQLPPSQTSSSVRKQQQVFVAPNPRRSEPVVFVAPIVRRVGGTPIIDVTFNGNQRFEMIVDTGASGTVITQDMANALAIVPMGKAKANTASAKAVEFPIGYVDSIEAAGVKVKKIAVAIAGSELEIGLLGHDFFGEYDLTIKRDVVEFRPSSYSQQLNSPETGLTVPTSPKRHQFGEFP